MSAARGREWLARVRAGDLLVFDGGYGTMLFAAGLTNGACPELWNETHAAVVQDIHRGYFDAGSDLRARRSGVDRSRVAIETIQVAGRRFAARSLGSFVEPTAGGGGWEVADVVIGLDVGVLQRIEACLLQPGQLGAMPDLAPAELNIPDTSVLADGSMLGILRQSEVESIGVESFRL